MKTISGRIIFWVTQVLYLAWFISFLYQPQAWWIHVAGIAATLLFLWRIGRSDD